MKLVPWQSPADVMGLRKNIDSLFREMMEGSDVQDVAANWSPRVDIHEDDDSFIFTADLPGVKKEDISITTQDNVLTIKGKKEIDRDEKKKSFHRIERFSGEYERSFRLPRGIDSDKINAKYKDGELMVSIPKKPEAKKKEIKVEIE
ncbi:MAG: Hsp20/alpha crystallin family protein [Candidatus Zixiibacteriota bacterium]